jgi:tryptophan synthase alpha chain
MSRIESTFAALKAQGRKALIPYVMAGFPYADITPDLMHGMVAAGADIIELGVPFQRPVGRRPGDPEGWRKGAGPGHRHLAGAGHGEGIPHHRQHARPWC